MEKLTKKNGLLITLVLLLVILPLVFVKGEYGGADGEAQEKIEELYPTYKPWFNPLIELPSQEIESLLFSSQAALGAGIVGYVIGFYKGKKK